MEDFVQTSSQLVYDFFGNLDGERQVLRDRIAAAIRAAVEEERLACVQLAQEIAPPEGQGGYHWARACLTVAKAIRFRTSPASSAAIPP